MSAIDRLLGETASLVEAELDALLPRAEPPVARLAEAMRYAVMGGGKRLRAALVRAAYRAVGGEGGLWLRPAAAIEILHAYSLIHDDLPAMDNADLRRGRPSCHKAFDEAMAILAGDALQAYAYEILLRDDWGASPEQRIAVAHGLSLASGTLGMCAGQVLDLAGEKVPLDLAGLEHMEGLKTGALIAFSLETGARLGGADEAGAARLAGFGRDLGLAFQIRDDVLDAIGDPALTGKPRGADEAAGKTTFVSLLGVEAAERRARGLRDRACAGLDFLGPGASLLVDLFDFVIERDH
jgi:farnesyl diphosphate synthase